MSAPHFDSRAALRTISPARSLYERYECDFCHGRIGYEGAVRLRATDLGARVVWAAVCPACQDAGKRI